MKKITFKNITNILPEPRSKGYESWEFRFLFSEGEPRRLIYVDADESRQMMRLTFPMDANNGRGRIWIKRSEINQIDKEDISSFIAIIESLQHSSGLDVLVSPSAHKLIAQSIGATEFFESPYTIVDKRTPPRNYDDKKYLLQELHNPYSTQPYARVSGQA